MVVDALCRCWGVKGPTRDAQPGRNYLSSLGSSRLRLRRRRPWVAPAPAPPRPCPRPLPFPPPQRRGRRIVATDRAAWPRVWSAGVLARARGRGPGAAPRGPGAAPAARPAGKGHRARGSRASGPGGARAEDPDRAGAGGGRESTHGGGRRGGGREGLSATTEPGRADRRNKHAPPPRRVSAGTRARGIPVRRRVDDRRGPRRNRPSAAAAVPPAGPGSGGDGGPLPRQRLPSPSPSARRSPRLALAL